MDLNRAEWKCRIQVSENPSTFGLRFSWLISAYQNDLSCLKLITGGTFLSWFLTNSWSKNMASKTCRFRGPCLLDAIDSLQPPQRDYSKPFLMPICDVRAQSQGQVSICGKLERGILQTGNKVLQTTTKFLSLYPFFLVVTHAFGSHVLT